jgi:hypothetical protein
MLDIGTIVTYLEGEDSMVEYTQSMSQDGECQIQSRTESDHYVMEMHNQQEDLR